LARITINDVKLAMGITETYDIVNAIANENPVAFKQYVPLANAENIAAVGQGILINQTVQNEFITTLVDRIGLVVVSKTLLNNPLKRFKKGQLPMGRTIEQIFTDITQEKLFDQEEAEETVFKREIPDVKTLFHEVNRKGFYKQTISQEQLSQAFTSWSSFDNFVSSIIRTINNSAEVDEYKYMKLLVDNYYSKGLFTVVPVVDPVDTTSASEFVKKLRATAKKMTLPMGSRDWNALAVHTRSEMETLHLFIDADLEAELDVDVLAKAFNMDKTTFLGSVTVIDGFASVGLKAVLVDEEFFMVYDKLQKSETIRNPQGLYWNQFFHVWQVMSTSRFANAVAFVTGAVKEVTSVIVDPTLASLKAGKSMEFTAYVRATDGEEHPVTWAVVAGDNDGSSVAAGTSINADGILTLGATQTGQLKVTATVSVDPDGTPANGDEYDVIGEAIVTVIPAS
jgi:hypothetical protein